MILFGRYRVIEPRRFRNFILISSIFLFILISVTIYQISAYSANTYNYMEIPVIEGDTLWQIAKDYGPSGSIQKDLYELMKLNELKDGRIYPGQVLIVPIV